MSHKKIKFLVVDLEPTPYKIDLWNEFNRSEEFNIFVIFSQGKDWSPESGHNYQELPISNFSHEVYSGMGFLSMFRSLLKVLHTIISWNPDITVVAGYSMPLQLFSIMLSSFLKKKFAVLSDGFNNNFLEGRFSILKTLIRYILRKIVKLGDGNILVCGKKGVESAIKAGFSKSKVYDFPYVVSLERILKDSPLQIPQVCQADLESSPLIILFSGRMIFRKGLESLLYSLQTLTLEEWVLWIEGDGPYLDYYTCLSNDLNLAERCRFLGFCQMSLHSWLLRTSDIIVVPSLSDRWGIVVDEAMQLGKAVIASDATGSGQDRIEHNQNGLLFNAGNSNELSSSLKLLMTSKEERCRLGLNASATASYYTPERNVSLFLKMCKKDSSAIN